MLYRVMILASIVLFFIPILFILTKAVAVRKFPEKRRKSEVSKILIFSGFLIMSIWCLRFASGFLKAPDATIIEIAFDSFFGALKTFSIDQEYFKYIDDLKEVFDKAVSTENIRYDMLKTYFVIYASFLNLAAPVAGGAIIFEVIASIFPKIKMWFAYLCFWRKKYFFSGLNEVSLCLAKGILSANKSFFCKPVIIFTDAYVDKEDEKKSELSIGAKTIGAICITDDIAHVKKNQYGSRIFLLIEENESSNLQTLTDLSNKYNAKFLKKSEIFYITSSDAYIEIEKRINEKFDKEYKFKEKDMPVFIPVNGYRNMIYDLLVKIPLFEPLIEKKKISGKRNLTVTILGAGEIGTEMFLATYWFGQILDCNLKINVVSKESEKDFWGKIDYINPEIKHTTLENDPILTVNRKGDKAPVYCEVNYVKCDAKSSDFIECLSNPESTDELLKTDYFFVSLGTDDINISVANTLKRYVGEYHISQDEPLKTIISYVVYDADVSETLNGKTLFSFVGKTADVLMYAVGNLKEVYSAKNVFMSEFNSDAMQLNDAYLSVKGKKAREETHKGRLKDDYKYWASLAFRLHIKYKAFSMGMYYSSIFNFEGLNDECYLKSIEVFLDEFERVASGKIDLDKVDARKQINLLNRMAWLEHRRWNAFTRVKGFRCTSNYDKYSNPEESGSYKQMELKLHPCLVECDEKGLRGNDPIDARGNIDTTKLLKCTQRDDFDLLDDLSYDLYDKLLNSNDFKQYDYPSQYVITKQQKEKTKCTNLNRLIQAKLSYLKSCLTSRKK